MKKYTHSKEGTKRLLKKHQRSLDMRKASDQADSLVVTIEKIYGFFTPDFGGSLGANYSKTTGLISKNHRASAVA